MFLSNFYSEKYCEALKEGIIHHIQFRQQKWDGERDLEKFIEVKELGIDEFALVTEYDFNFDPWEKEQIRTFEKGFAAGIKFYENLSKTD